MRPPTYWRDAARVLAALGAATTVLASACTDPVATRTPPANPPALATTAAVAPTLTWLAPLGTGTADSATFDAAAAPQVEVCAWTGTSCAAAPLARFSTAPAAGELPLTVNAAAGRYEATWSLANATFTTRTTYRIRVLQGTTELGAVLVDAVRARWALTRADGTAAPLVAATALPIWFALAPPPTLTVMRDPGVQGTPAAGVTPYYPPGTRVSYAFEAMPGYEGLRVQVDGVDAPAAGAITMGASHQILAFARRIPVVSAAAQPLVPLARALLTVTDAASAQRASEAYEAAADTLYQTLGPAEARRQLAEVAAMTFDPVRDSAAFRRTVNWLAEAKPVFTQLTAPAALSASRAASPRTVTNAGTATDAGVGTRPTTIIYVNGVLSTQETAKAGLREVAWLAVEAGLVHGDVRITNVYNPTWLAAPLGGPASCIAAAATNPLLGVLGKLAAAVRCAGVVLGPVEVVGQWATGILGDVPLTTPTSSEVGQVVRGELDQGRKVLLVGHSQGNMMIQQALRGLEQTLPAAAMQCVAVTSAAPPVTNNWPTVVHTGFFAKGSRTHDFLLDVVKPTPVGTPVSTNVTDAADARIEAAQALADASGGGGVQTITENAALHAFVASYMFGDNLRTALREDLAAHAQALEAQCQDVVVITPPPGAPVPLPIAVGVTATLSAEVRSATGVTLAGRTVAWESLDPAVATVSSAGVVTGVSAGTATIRATSGSARADVTVTITANSGAPVRVTVTPNPAIVQRDLPTQLTAQVTDLSGSVAFPGRTVEWQSLTPSVLSVSANGIVQARSLGTGTIRALSGDAATDVQVTVCYDRGVLPIGNHGTLPAVCNWPALDYGLPTGALMGTNETLLFHAAGSILDFPYTLTWKAAAGSFTPADWPNHIWYTAPSEPGHYTFSGTTGDTLWIWSADVYVSKVSLSITPASLNITRATGGQFASQQLTAVIEGLPYGLRDNSVAWTTDRGTIQVTGRHTVRLTPPPPPGGGTGPEAPGEIHVTAYSVQDSRVQARATIFTSVTPAAHVIVPAAETAAALANESPRVSRRFSPR